MGYSILRTEKIKTNTDFKRRLEHNYRLRSIANASPALKSRDEELVPLVDSSGRPCSYLDAYHEKINSLEYYKTHKVMRTNVRGIEVVTTFSRENRNDVDIDQWKTDNVKWMREYFNKCPEKYGDNVISVMFHDDENGNTHCHAIIIPIDEDGKLSASKYLNGRAMMHAMQDSYAKAMEHHGLKRGLKGSTARHEDISKFYAKLNEKMEVPQPEKDETAEAYRDRMLKFIQTERADSLRKVMDMDRELRRLRDEKTQRDMVAVKGAAHAEVASLESERNHLLQDIQNAKQELLQLREEIQNDEKKRETKRHSLDDEMAKKVEEIAAMNARAREIHEKIGSLEQAKRDLDEYRYQQSALEYARKEFPLLAEDVERDLTAIMQAYNREMDIEK